MTGSKIGSGSTKMSAALVAVGVVALAIGGIPSSANAAVILDQENAESGRLGTMTSLDFGEGVRRIQTVTAGLTGELVVIQLQIQEPSRLEYLRIIDTAGGVPTRILGLADFAGLSADGWASFNSSIPLNAGQVFGLEPISVGFNLWSGGGNTYSGGSDYFRNPPQGINSIAAGISDWNFRTFVETGTGAVPEPSTWAMLLLGFGFVGGAMRSAKRRQKSSVSYA